MAGELRSLLGALMLTMCAFSPASAKDAPPGAADMLQRVLPAVVNITTWKTIIGDDGTSRWTHYYSSGFIIDPDGTIVTNKHVVDGAELMAVTFSDGSRAVATVTATGGAVDLALLKVAVNRRLPVLTFADSSKLRIGDTVYTVGNPLGVGTSVSAGIVSALDRNIQDSPYDDFIQTDADLNHGNSGGPLIDTDGNVVGVDTALYSDIDNGGSIGLGFAIPSSSTRFVVERLRQYGSIRAGWIGAEMQDITATIAEALSMDAPWGAIVTAIDPNGPAAHADIQVGDVVQAMNGVRTDGARSLMRGIGRSEVGGTVTLTVLRHGAQREVPVPVAVFPADNVANQPAAGSATLAAIAEKPDFGIKVGTVNQAAHERYAMSVDTGVVISSVDPDSAAGAIGLVPGDVVLRVGDAAIANPDDFNRAAETALRAGRPYVLLLVQKKDGPKWVAVLTQAP